METRDFELLDLMKKGSSAVLRDDQSGFEVVLDSVKARRRRGSRLSLIVTGKFSVPELEWLGEAGTDIYASEESGLGVRELMLVGDACRRGGAIVAYHLRGFYDSGEKTPGFTSADLKDLAGSGIYLHLSNRDLKRDFSELIAIAYEAKKSGNWLVYYHHGSLSAELKDLARNGSWIHLSDSSLSETSDLHLILDAAALSRRAGSNLVVHLERGLPPGWLREIQRSGAVVLFKIIAPGPSPRMRDLERKQKKRGLDFRSYFLYPNFWL